MPVTINGSNTPTPGGITYGDATTAYATTAAGTAGQLLVSGGAGVPTWVSASSLTVGSATTATTSTNIAGGSLGTVPYQTAAGTTAMLATGTSGQVLTSQGAAAPAWTTIAGGNAANNIGYLNIPQNAQTGSYTLVLSDAGKHIYHDVGAGAATYTIPANSSVAYPIGTAVTFINLSSTAVSIAITTDTMYLSSAGTTGTRTLAQYGSATAIKITATNWIISGSGLT